MSASSRGLAVAKQLEEDLRLLSVEARKKYPLVKEAAERSIIKLRAKIAVLLRNVRSAGDNSTKGFVEGSKSTMAVAFRADEEILRPFVLACNHADVSVKLGVLSLSAFQRLLSRGAVEAGQFPNIVRVLRIQSLSHEDAILLRILQTLPLILTATEFEVPEDSLRQAVLICSELGGSSSSIIKSLASATLRQLLTVLYERVESLMTKLSQEDQTEFTKSNESVSPPARATRGGHAQTSLTPPAFLSGICKHAYMLFQDLCLMGKGESGVWLGHASISKVLAMELIEELLGSHQKLFHSSSAFGDIIKHHVCPLVIKSLRSQVNFPLMIRLMRLVALLVVEFHELLATECEIFITLLIRMIPRPGDSSLTVTPWWHCALTLEVLHLVCQNDNLLRFLYRHFDADADAGATQIFGNIMKTLSRFIVDAFAYGQRVAKQDTSVNSASPSTSSTMLGVLVSESSEVDTAFDNVVGSIGDRSTNASSRFEGGWTLGAHMDDLTAQALAGSNGSGAGGRVAQWLKRVSASAPRYTGIKVLHMKDSEEPPKLSLAVVVLAAHECILGIVHALTLTHDQINATTPMKGRPAFASDPGNEFGCGRRMSSGDMSSSFGFGASSDGNSEGHSGKNMNDDDGNLILNRFNQSMRGMTLATWRPLNEHLELILEHCTDERLVHDALRAYQMVTNTCGVLELVQVRDTLISSLCAFALPSQGSQYPRLHAPGDINRRSDMTNQQLGAKNVKALETLFNIAHCLGGFLENSWLLILETFSRLAIIIQQSSHDAVCSDVKSGNLIDVKSREKQKAVEENSVSNRLILSSKILTRSSSSGSSGSETGRTHTAGLGELGRGHATENDLKILKNAMDKLFEASKHLESNGLKHLLSSLGALSVGHLMESGADESPASERALNPDVIDEEYNDTWQLGKGTGNRGTNNSSTSSGHASFVSSALSNVMSRWSKRSGKLRQVEQNTSTSRGGLKDSPDETPPFALLKLIETTKYNMHRIDIAWDITAIHLHMIASRNPNSQLRAFCTHSLAELTSASLLAINERDDLPNISQSDILKPLCRCYESAHHNIRQITLVAVEDLLKTCGHILSDGWVDVISLLQSIANGSEDADGDDGMVSEFIPIGFRSLQLVADEFLDSLTSPNGIQRCLDCLFAYAKQRLDLNISLTAIGAIWAMTDFVRQQLENESNVDGIDDLWICIVTILQSLSLDFRAPVRNSAMKTLFSTLATHGTTLSSSVWDRIISSDGLLFSLLNDATEKQKEMRGQEKHGKSPGGAKYGESDYMVVHHSRDTSYKQWNESRVIAIEGVARMISQFFPQIQKLECFTNAWMELITIIRNGILCFRSVESSSEAEIAHEIFLSHTRAASRLMNMVSSIESEGNIQTSQLWRSLWDFVSDFGNPEDLVHDCDETICKIFIQIFGKIFIDAYHDMKKLKSIHGSKVMILKFIGLAEKVMSNRPPRNTRSKTRFTSVTSAAEREYVLTLESLSKYIDKERSIDIQIEILNVFCRHLSNRTLSSVFLERCCDAVRTIYAASDAASKIEQFSSLNSELTALYLSDLSSANSHLSETVHAALLAVVKHGLSSFSSIKIAAKEKVASTWNDILNSLDRVLKQNAKSVQSDHQIALLNTFVENILPLLQSRTAPSSVQVDLINILDCSASSFLSTSVQEACTKHLFRMMKLESEDDSRESITSTVASVVLRRCSKTLKDFAARREGQGNQTADVLKVLRQLQELQYHPDAQSEISGAGGQLHLLKLFPILCDCVGALGSGPGDSEIATELASLLRFLGSVAGLS